MTTSSIHTPAARSPPLGAALRSRDETHTPKPREQFRIYPEILRLNGRFTALVPRRRFAFQPTHKGQQRRQAVFPASEKGIARTTIPQQNKEPSERTALSAVNEQKAHAAVYPKIRRILNPAYPRGTVRSAAFANGLVRDPARSALMVVRP